MKKKISVLIACFFCAAIAIAQTPYSPVPSGTPNQLFDYNGGIRGKTGFINARFADTLAANAAPISLQSGGQIAVGDIIYVRSYPNHDKWIAIGTGTFVNDTLQAFRPLKIDSVSPTLSTIKELIQRGLVYGGTTTMHSCLSIDVIPTGVFINYNFYSNPGVTLTVNVPDLSHDRTDAVVIDTLGQISIIPGTPSVFPQTPSIDIASQFLLTTYTVKAGASCIGIITEIVYDQNTGPSAEWTATTFGTVTNDFANTLNPFHLTIADLLSVYHNGSGLIFTKTGNDTAQANEILKLYIYSNGIFNNQIKIEFFLDAAPVGNQITFNSGYGFDGANANVYQNTSIPFSAFGLTNQIFNKIVITYAGDDLSGTGGLYNDYIQLQTGVTNTGSQLILTTIGSSGAATYNSTTGVLNIPIYGGGNSDSTLQQVTDGSIRAGDNPYINNHGNGFELDSVSSFTLSGMAGQRHNFIAGDNSSGNNSVLGLQDQGAQLETSWNNGAFSSILFVDTAGILLKINGPSSIRIGEREDGTPVTINASPIINPDSIAVFDLDTLRKAPLSSIHIKGTSTLSGGTITVTNSRIKTGAIIFVSVNAPAGTQGFLSAKTSDIINLTSFIINSTSATETSTVNWEIINP